jgi:hypothetical protein
MTKNDLISHYVNLYRQLWLSNEGLWTDQLKQMSKKELKWGIKDMKRAIKEKQYKGGMSKYDTAQELEEMLDDVRPQVGDYWNLK